MEIEVRGVTTEVNDYMCAAAQRVLESCAEMYGCQMEMKLMGSADSLDSDETFCPTVYDIMKQKLPLKHRASAGVFCL
ncbi:MAG: hypothetical protein IJZ56_03075 [Oscillospiraceae bacterium]|nr:hypothetical protein [Oscillospiraceae bacterium]